MVLPKGVFQEIWDVRYYYHYFVYLRNVCEFPSYTQCKHFSVTLSPPIVLTTRWWKRLYNQAGAVRMSASGGEEGKKGSDLSSFSLMNFKDTVTTLPLSELSYFGTILLLSFKSFHHL